MKFRANVKTERRTDVPHENYGNCCSITDSMQAVLFQ